MNFVKVDGTSIDLIGYTKAYIKSHPEVEIIIGCDSQNKGSKTQYAAVVAFYNPGHGAHVIYSKWQTPKEYTNSIRLINEVWTSIEIAESIKYIGCKAKYIDIDINPNPKYKSNSVFKQAVGMCEGMGYKVRFKTLCPLITTFADWIVRS